MADRGAGRGVPWFVVGFLAGVAATLAVLIIGSLRSTQPVETSPSPRAAVVTYTPPRTSMRRAPVAPRLAGSSEPSALTAPAGGPDEQVQEDAAATGMTSRRVQPAADIH